jgi:hypothetical protein
MERLPRKDIDDPAAQGELAALIDLGLAFIARRLEPRSKLLQIETVARFQGFRLPRQRSRF